MLKRSQDLVDEIEAGALQHMGENVLALLRYLTLPSTSLTNIQKSKSTVFFSLHGGAYFFVFSAATARIAYALIWIATLAFVAVRARRDRKAAYGLAIAGVTTSLIFAVIAANFVALFTSHLRGRALSWCAMASALRLGA